MGVCGKTYQLAATVSGTPTLVFAWTGAGSSYLNSTSAEDPLFTSALAGTYTLVLTVTDTYGCTASDNVTIVVDPAPTADAGAGTTMGVCGKTYQLAATVTGTATLGFAWTGAGSSYLSSTAIEDPIFTSAVSGTYTLVLTVTDAYGCTASDNVTIVVAVVPVANAGADQSVCSDIVSTTLSGCLSTGAGLGCAKSPLIGGTYSWSPNLPVGVLSPTNTALTTVDLSLLSDGLHTFTLTVTDLYGCTSSDDVVITINPLPVITVPSSFTVCNMAASFALSSLSGFTQSPAGGTWTFTGATDPFNPATAGTGVHTLTYTYTAAGCDAHDSFTITVDAPGAATLEGQVKYWNASETYMPTPFPTDIYGTTPPDYFYVALYEVGTGSPTITSPADIDPSNPLVNALDWEKVDIVQEENGAGVITKNIMSYFKFSTTLDPAKTYFMTVWDGSNLWQEFVNEGTTTGWTYNPALGSAYTWNRWGGVSSADALAMQYMVGGATPLNNGTYMQYHLGNQTYGGDLNYGFYSNSIANVNSVNNITALDKLTTQYRIAGLQPTFPNNTPNFRVAGRFVDYLPRMTFPATAVPDSARKMPFTVGNAPDVVFTKNLNNPYQYFTKAISHYYWSGTFDKLKFYQAQNNENPAYGVCPDYGYINLYYEATGDVNASYVPTSTGFPGYKSDIALQYENEVTVQKGQIIDIPVSIDRSAELGYLDLGLTFRKDMIKVMEVPGYQVVNIDNEKGFVRLAWADMNGKSVNADETIVIVKALVLADITADVRLVELEAMTDMGDVNAKAIEGVTLKTVAVSTSKPVAGSTDMFVANYPNPFNSKTTISYNLPENGRVSLVVYNKLGAVVTTLIDQVQSAGSYTFDLNRGSLAAGVYTYRLILKGTDTHTATKNMVITE
jgi:hypothetical protein